MGFRLFLCFSFMAALFINGVIPAQPDIIDKNEKRQILRKRLQKTKESVDELAVELAKTHLINLIVNKHHKIEEVTKSIKTLDRDRCTDLKSVHKPVAHNTLYVTQGAWMKDPLGIMGTETIFVMIGHHGNKLVEYKNMNDFKAGVPLKTYTLPHAFDGTGAVVYGPFLYYNRANTNHLIKYNLKTQRVEASITIGHYTPRRNYYQWAGYSGMDLAVDEQGLWVISGSTGNSYRPYISKIDVKYNRVIQTWGLSGVERMSHMGNSFMACGVFYAVDSFNQRTTTINYAYDTKTGRRWNPGLPFVNQYGYNSMIDYNPRERVLYSWDNKRLVTYSLNFKS